jgi:hypothetical protein
MTQHFIDPRHATAAGAIDPCLKNDNPDDATAWPTLGSIPDPSQWNELAASFGSFSFFLVLDE